MCKNKNVTNNISNKGRVPKKNVKVWSLTKPADPPPMLKYGLLIVKIFFSSFFGYQSVSNLIKGILDKKTFLSHFDIVLVMQIVGRKGTNTKKEEHTSTQVQ